MTIKPLFDKIVIEAMESMDKTQSGIVLDRKSTRLNSSHM